MISGQAEIRITVDSAKAEADIKRTTAAVDNFKATYAKANSNVINFNKAMKRSTVQIGNNRTTVRHLTDTLAGYNQVQVKALQNSGRAAVAFEKQRTAALRHRKTLTQLRNETLAIVAAYHSAIAAFQLYNAHVIQTKDNLILLRTQVENVTKSQSVFNDLGESAFELGVKVQDLTNYFTRLGIATDGAFDTNTLIDWSEKLVLTGQSFGLSFQEVNSAVRQFTQGMASGRLQGEELRSILENMPPLAKALAEVMDTNIGNLRQLGKQGKITIDEMAQALNNLQVNIDDLPSTFEKAVNRLSTAWSMLMDQLVPEDSMLTSVVNLLANGLNYVAKLIQQTHILLSAVKVAIYDSLSAFSQYLESEKMATFFAEKRVEAYNELSSAMARMKDAPGGFRNLDAQAGTNGIEEYEASRNQLKIFLEEQEKLTNEFGLTSKELELYNLQLQVDKALTDSLTQTQRDQITNLSSLAERYINLRHSMIDEEFLNAQKESLAQSFLSESELQIAHYMEQQELLNQWHQNNLDKKVEYYDLAEQLEIKHMDRMAKIDQRHMSREQRMWQGSWQGKLQVASGVLGNLSTLMQSENKKQFEIGKKAAIAQAVIDTISSAQAAFGAMAGIPYVGPALGAAAAAAAIVAGMARVQQIKSTQFGGGASVSASGGGSTPSIAPPQEPAVAQQETTSTTIQFIGDTYGMEDFQEVVVQTIQDAVNDRDVVIIDSDSRQAQDLVPA